MTRDQAQKEATNLINARTPNMDPERRRKNEDRVQYLFGYIDALDALDAVQRVNA